MPSLQHLGYITIYVDVRCTITYLRLKSKINFQVQIICSCCFRHDGDINNDIGNKDNDGLPYSHNQTCNRHNATPEYISRYEQTTKTFLCNILIPLEALSCTDSRCESIQHRNDIDNMYAGVYIDN